MNFSPIKILGISVLTLFAFTSAASAAPLIPVYPGSVLDVGATEDTECCDFSTADSIAKVSMFYATALRGDALTVDEASARFPQLAEHFAELKKQLPAGVSYRAVALPGEDGKIGSAPQLFELLGAAGLVNYTITEDSIRPEDADYTAEFRARTGRLNEAEKVAAHRKEEERLEREKLASEDRQWRKALGAAGVMLYPDAIYYRSEIPEPVTGAEVPAAPLLGIYESYSLYEKIKDFYGARLNEVSEETIPSRRKVTPFRYAEGGAERSYTSRSRAGVGRSYYAGKGCVDVAILEGKGGETGQKIAKIIFDFNPECKEAEELTKTLRSVRQSTGGVDD